VRDGEQTLEYLQGIGRYGDRQRFPFPDVLVLDLKMPIKSGFEVIDWMRCHPEFSKVEVVVLSASDDGHDIQRVTGLGVEKFFVKSPSLEDVMQHLREP
jgi:two-component system response regulator